jgi:hypothetical protein
MRAYTHCKYMQPVHRRCNSLHTSVHETAKQYVRNDGLVGTNSHCDSIEIHHTEGRM